MTTKKGSTHPKEDTAVDLTANQYVLEQRLTTVETRLSAVEDVIKINASQAHATGPSDPTLPAFEERVKRLETRVFDENCGR
jgi:uncharacterized coiled-coil protein SlyX